MAPPYVHVAGVVIWCDALAQCWVGNTDCGLTVLHRITLRPRVGPEVAVERPVLLHDDHNVLDLVDTFASDWGVAVRLACGGGPDTTSVMMDVFVNPFESVIVKYAV